MSNTILLVLAAIAAAGTVLVLVRPLRRALISRSMFATYRKVLPQMSETERDALEAGTVWWDGELFRGKPDWKKLLAYPTPKLTAAEQSFMDNEVEEACAPGRRLAGDARTLRPAARRPGTTSRTRASSA